MTVVDLFVFDGCQVVAGAVQAPVVVPVDPLQDGQFDVVQALPGPARVDDFGLEQADLGLGQGVVEGVADAADAGAAPAWARRSVNAMEVYWLPASL